MECMSAEGQAERTRITNLPQKAGNTRNVEDGVLPDDDLYAAQVRMANCLANRDGGYAVEIEDGELLEDGKNLAEVGMENISSAMATSQDNHSCWFH